MLIEGSGYKWPPASDIMPIQPMNPLLHIYMNMGFDILVDSSDMPIYVHSCFPVA